MTFLTLFSFIFFFFILLDSELTLINLPLISSTSLHSLYPKKKIIFCYTSHFLALFKTHNKPIMCQRTREVKQTVYISINLLYGLKESLETYNLQKTTYFTHISEPTCQLWVWTWILKSFRNHTFIVLRITKVFQFKLCPWAELNMFMRCYEKYESHKFETMQKKGKSCWITQCPRIIFDAKDKTMGHKNFFCH